MKATVYRGEGDVRIEEVEDPEIQHPEDAIIRITHTCICGSDLWFYRGEEENQEEGSIVGHEPMGVVEETGSEVTSLEEGDRVISPFSQSCGECEFCRKGIQTACKNAPFFGEDQGAQSALETAAQIVRPGGSIGYVGVPHLEDPEFINQMFYKNVSLEGGPAPVREYLEELMKDVLQGTLDPSPVLDKTVDLDGVPEGYEAMDNREAIKVMVKVGE